MNTNNFVTDMIWPLIPIAEWCISLISNILRSAVLAQGDLSFSSDAMAEDDPTSSSSPPLPPQLILILHPVLRSQVLRILAQLFAFKTFVSKLDQAILQPESKFAPQPQGRDPRATIVARERIGDLGWRDGVDVMHWGRKLQGLEGAFAFAFDWRYFPHDSLPINPLDNVTAIRTLRVLY